MSGESAACITFAKMYMGQFFFWAMSGVFYSLVQGYAFCHFIFVFGPGGLHIIHLHFPHVFGGHFSSVLTYKFIFCPLVGGTGNVYFANLATAFHAGGNIDGVAPNIVRKLFGANHPRHQRPCVDADTGFKNRLFFPVLFVVPFF